MKRVITLVTIILFVIGLFAQVPEKMSYQAVIRDASDMLVTNSNIGMQISILQGSANGTAIYVERHFPTTDANGLVSLVVATGTIISGDFSVIAWSDGPYFIKTETDLNGGSNYTITGTSQLLSVPYALHAKTVESVDYTNGISLPYNFGPDTNFVGSQGNSISFGHEETSEDFIGYKDNRFYFKDSPGGGDMNDPDIIVGGNVGIGTDDPSALLHVAGQIRMNDGSEGDYKMLVSDVNGAASWKGAPGVDYVEDGGGEIILSDEHSSNINSVTITTPGPGYIIVTASGSIYHSISGGGQFLVRVKVSEVEHDVSESPGVQSIKWQLMPVTAGSNMYPFSVSKVFQVGDADTYTYYLNMWHEVINGVAYVDDYTLIGTFIPYAY